MCPRPSPSATSLIPIADTNVLIIDITLAKTNQKSQALIFFFFAIVPGFLMLNIWG